MVPTDIKEAAADWMVRRDAGLSAAEERAFQAWLSEDPRHAMALDHFNSVWRTLDRPLRTGTADLVLGELAVRARRRTRRRQVIAAAGAMAAVFAIVLSLNLRQPEFGESSEIRPVTAGLPSIRALPDGSVVELHEAGRITVDFNDRMRRVVLHEGGADFRVKTDPERPFIVIGRSLEVRVIGTVFSVQLGQSTVEVLVTSGRVAVDTPSVIDATGAPGSHASSRQTLAIVEAGNGVVVDLTPSPGGLPIVDLLASAEVYERLAWRTPRLEFSGTPLLEVIDLMNRHNQLQFKIEDPELASVRVSGIFGAYDTDAFVRVLEAGFNVEAESRGENEIVLRRAR